MFLGCENMDLKIEKDKIEFDSYRYVLKPKSKNNQVARRLSGVAIYCIKNSTRKFKH
jgi:hypothetical protein